MDRSRRRALDARRAWPGVAAGCGRRRRFDMSLVTKLQEFSKDVRVEFTKVSWPTRREVRSSTIVTIVTVILIAIYIGIADRIITFLLGLLFR
jgi:preprotein translocase subunit SecE